MMFGDGGWMPAMHGGWMLLVWGLLIVVAAWLLARLLRGEGAPREPPRQILQRRLASGEITPQEYHERLASLEPASRSGQPPARG